MSGPPPSEVRRTAAMTVLTVIAGAVDAASFLTLGKASWALVTGDALFLSFAPAGEGEVPVARAAAAVAAFPAGAALGAPALAGLAARGRPPLREATPRGTLPAHLPASIARLGADTGRRPQRVGHPPSAWKPAASRTRPAPPGTGPRVGRPRATRPRSPRRCRRSPPCGPR
ncbi:DUF1275 family protein [Streptomyces sp. SMS_SU21]|uniref:DUF1275 family protein n=1 Tax=Streptomyces sp. SMS_SU21 TaxID=2069440 RepID=UPI000C884527